MDYKNKYLKYKNKYLELKNKLSGQKGGVIQPKPIPRVGLGTWELQDENDQQKYIDLFYNALRIGYRCFDCATIYRSEKNLGIAIQRAIAEGIVTREELFIIGKADLLGSFRVSLKDLQIDKFDLALFHHYHGPEDWDLMVELKRSGLADNIGVSNIYINKLRTLLNYCDSRSIERPVAIEDEINLYCPEVELVNYCNEQDIKIIAYTPLGQKEGLRHLQARSDLNEIASIYSITVGQLLLLWAVRRGITVIPLSTNEERLIQNLDVNRMYDNPGILTEEHFNEITRLSLDSSGFPSINDAVIAKVSDE